MTGRTVFTSPVSTPRHIDQCIYSGLVLSSWTLSRTAEASIRVKTQDNCFKPWAKSWPGHCVASSSPAQRFQREIENQTVNRHMQCLSKLSAPVNVGFLPQIVTISIQHTLLNNRCSYSARLLLKRPQWWNIEVHRAPSSTMWGSIRKCKMGH